MKRSNLPSVFCEGFERETSLALNGAFEVRMSSTKTLGSRLDID